MKDKHQINIDTYKSKDAVDIYVSAEGIRDIEKEFISKYFNGKILDIGCGGGRTTKYIHEQGFDVIGVDIIKDMIKRAKKKYPKVKFETGDACKLKYESNSFDVVFFSFNGVDYIHPEEKRLQALKELTRVLKRGGVFIFSSHTKVPITRVKFILRNLVSGNLFSKYKLEKQKFGELYTYYNAPLKEIKLVEKNTILDFEERIDDDIFTYYVFRKPIQKDRNLKKYIDSN